MKRILSYQPAIKIATPAGSPDLKITGQFSDWVSDGEMLRNLRDQLPRQPQSHRWGFAHHLAQLPSTLGELAKALLTAGEVTVQCDDGTHGSCVAGVCATPAAVTTIMGEPGVNDDGNDDGKVYESSTRIDDIF
jgi:hypothetical protein